MTKENRREQILDGLKHISQIQRAQLDERRKYEWKIFLASVSFYVLSVAAIYKGEIKLQGNYISILLIYFVFLAQAIVTNLFLAHVHIANNKNKSLAEDAEKEIADLIGYDIKAGSNNYWDSCNKFLNRKATGRGVFFCQAVMIFIFAITSAIVITLRCP